MTVIAATGHRPEKLGGYAPQVGLALGGLATEYLSRARPDKVISGMALGWDQAVAAACVALGIPFTAAVPFEGQDSRWPAESRARYRRLLACAKHVEIVTPRGGDGSRRRPCDAGPQRVDGGPRSPDGRPVGR